MTSESAERIAYEATARRRDGVTLVAIDGLGGAGKSTLAAAIKERCGAAVIHGDDFYRPMDADLRAELSAEEGYDLYFDWQRLRDEVLRPLAARRPAIYERYDWLTGELAVEETHRVPAVGIVIVEGVYASRPEISDFYDLVIYVDTSAEVSMRRLRQRGADHGPIDWVSRWRLAEEHYVFVTQPRDRADIVVSGDSAVRYDDH